MTKLTYEKTNRTKAAAKQALPSVKEQTDALVETILSAGKAASAAGAPAPNNSKEKPKQPPMTTRPPVPQPQAEKPPPAGKALAAQPLSAAEFRAEFKAQQVKRLMAQVDQNAEELVDAIMGSRAAAPPGAAKKRGQASTMHAFRFRGNPEWGIRNLCFSCLPAGRRLRCLPCTSEGERRSA